jgi:SPX domain protein involved in polyphosphate accumulation
MVYQEYLKESTALSLQEAEEIYDKIHAAVFKDDDPDALELWNDLLVKAMDYTKIRCEWSGLSREEKLERDASRTSCHDSLIRQFQILERYLVKMGKDTSWRELLGDTSKDPYLRKRIGDMGAYICLFTSISNR